MKLKLMTVATSTDKFQSKIMITGSWLDRFGFSAETIVTVFYHNGQLTMQARGIGLDVYQQFVAQVRRQRGQMIQVFHWTRKKTDTHLVLEGNWLERQGFMIGDPIVMGFEPGLIRIKHILPGNMRGALPSKATYRITKVQLQKGSPMILLNAGWLQDYGFVDGQDACLSYESGFLSIQPYSQNTMKKPTYGTMPMQVHIRSKRNTPCLQMAGRWLSEIGYCPGNHLIVQCHENGLQIQPLHDPLFCV